MENGEKEIRGLFGAERVFVVPRFQRSYAWGERQLLEFLEDLTLHNSRKKYFLGTLLFQRELRPDGFEKIDVVDGQQRLTTIVILMKVLIEQIAARSAKRDLSLLRRRYISDGDRRKLQLQGEENEFFGTYVMGDQVPTAFDQPSHRRLNRAKALLTSQMAGRTSEQIEQLLAKLESAVVLTYAVEDAAEATLIFETINDRGKRLTNLEKVKSLMMYRTSQDSDVPEDRLQDIQTRFAAIYRSQDQLDQDNSGLAEDSILRFHYITHFRWTPQKEEKPYDQPVRNIKRYFDALLVKGDKQPLLENIDRYAQGLRDGFASILALRESAIEPMHDLLILDRMANFWPLLMKIWSFDKTPNHEQVSRVARLLECFSFRAYGMVRLRGNSADTRLFGFARDFNGDFDALIAELKWVNEAYAPDHNLREALGRQDLYNQGGHDTKYLLWKYENHLRSKLRPRAEKVSQQEYESDDSRTKLTLEHILPQNKSQMLGEDAEERLLHCLGNLALLSSSANSGLHDLDWADKKATFAKYPFKALLELPRFVEQGGEWGLGSIEFRRKAIVEFAMGYWDYRSI